MLHSYIESINGRLRDECLNEHWFETLHQACTDSAKRRRDSNELTGGPAPVRCRPVD